MTKETVAFNPKRFRRRGILLFLLLSFMLMAVITAFSAVYGQITVADWIHRAQFYVVPVKWAVEFLVILRWHAVCHWAARRLNLSDDHREYMLRARWVAARFLVVVEALLLLQLLTA